MLPLVAIATPATYVREPLRVFELDFEANLPIVRAVREATEAPRVPVDLRGLRHVRRRASSTPRLRRSCYGPINKQRWIYACSKQLMDRVIAAYGMEQGLDYTLFRPFNWIGSGLDSIYDVEGRLSRVVTQFLGHIVRGEPIQLVDGGTQKRAFTYIDDGIDALMTHHREPGRHRERARSTTSAIPRNNYSVRELAEMMLALAPTYPEYRRTRRRCASCETSAGAVLRQGLPGRAEPPARRSPNTTPDLDWQPLVTHARSRCRRIFEAYRSHIAEARGS